MYNNEGDEKQNKGKQFFEVSTTLLMIVFLVIMFLKFLYF